MNKILNAVEMGRKGGKNRAKNLTKERRSEIARMGGLKRWELDKNVIPNSNVLELDDKNKIC